MAISFCFHKLHLAKEEEIYLPLLEARLSAEEGAHLVEATEQVVAEARYRPRKGELREEPGSISPAQANTCTDRDGKVPYTVPQPSPVL